MPRKQNQHPEGYYKPFPERLRTLMSNSGTTQQALAEIIGVSRQTISYYCDGSSNPSSESIQRIAEYFNVSADWLLGLSEVMTPSIELQAICKYTGLTERNILLLHCNEFVDILFAINKLLSNQDFILAMFNFRKVFENAENYNKNLLEFQKKCSLSSPTSTTDILLRAAESMEFNQHGVYNSDGKYVLSATEAIELEINTVVDYFRDAVKNTVGLITEKIDIGEITGGDNNG